MDLNFDFESVARGEDTMITYGAVKWGFKLRAGLVQDEYLTPVDAASATFTEALERHRDFYVHEPVTFYFGFDKDTLDATETGKIDEFLPNLTRNASVTLGIEGFADLKGNADYNLDLSLRRAEAVKAALLAKGIDAARIDPITIGRGASASATTNAAPATRAETPRSAPTRTARPTGGQTAASSSRSPTPHRARERRPDSTPRRRECQRA